MPFIPETAGVTQLILRLLLKDEMKLLTPQLAGTKKSTMGNEQAPRGT